MDSNVQRETGGEKGIRILLVDDAPTICAVYAALLRQQGYRGEVAGSAQEAMQVACRLRPHLAVIDYHLPKENGDQLTRELLADPQLSGVLVVIHTERNGVEQLALESGAVDVIYKEDPQELFLLRIGSLSRFIEVQQKLQQNELELERQQGQKMASIGALASGVAHEFNNLLQPILGFSEMMLGRTDPATRDYERLTLVRQSALRGADLVRQILDFSRKDRPSPHQAIALQPLIKNILKMVQAVLPDQIRLNQQIDTSLEGVNLGATELHQVVLNLCNNSVQAIGNQSGEITISVIAELDWCRIVVKDSGHGMENRVRRQVFTPFFTTRDVGQGSGMGLSVVLGIVERAKGQINIESVPNKGTVVTIQLPMVPLRDGAEVLSIAPLHGHPVGRCIGRRILLVDDAPAVIAVGQEMLEEAGYQVETALSGREALQRYRSNPHDLVVTDFSMQGMNGVELGTEIQLIGHQTPMVLLTGVEVNVDQQQLQKGGFIKILQKPIVQSQLAEAVEEVL